MAVFPILFCMGIRYDHADDPDQDSRRGKDPALHQKAAALLSLLSTICTHICCSPYLLGMSSVSIKSRCRSSMMCPVCLLDVVIAHKMEHAVRG